MNKKDTSVKIEGTVVTVDDVIEYTKGYTLGTASIEDLYNELSRRFTAFTLLFERHEKESTTFNSWRKGSITTELGMLHMRLKEVMEDL